MARQDNPFALLGDDDDGGDVSVLLAKVEAKISPPTAPAELPPSKSKATAAGNEFPSKPLPPTEYVRAERGRGRGGRGRGPGRGGLGSSGGGNGNFNDDSAAPFGNRYARDFGADSDNRGRGRFGVGRGGRGRGRGRGYYEERGFSNENQFDAGKENRVQDGEWSNVRAEIQGKGYEVGENRGPELGNENKSYGWEEKGYSGENRHFRGAGGREGRGYGTGRGPRGGSGRRYGGRGGAGDERSGGLNGSQEKEDSADMKEQAPDIAPTDAAPSGWDVPEITDAQKVAETEQADAKQVVSENVPEEKTAEEEDKEMTLEEYEKVLQEKRKALDSLKSEERKVVVDKDFQSMLLIEKKKEVDHFVKLKSEKDKLKKKDSFEKEDKVRKSVSINEFLKPAEGDKYAGPSGHGRGGRGRGRGERGIYSGRRGPVASAPFIEDPGQFPLLGAAATAKA